MGDGELGQRVAAGQSELFRHVRAVTVDRPRADRQRAGDFLGGLELGDQAQHLAFGLGERLDARRRLGRGAGLCVAGDEMGRELRTDIGPAGGDRLQALDDLDQRPVLDHVSHRAGVQRRVQEPGIAVHRQARRSRSGGGGRVRWRRR